MNYNKLIILLGLLSFLLSSLFVPNSLALAAESAETITVKQYRLAYYDIWKNSAGQWVEGIAPEGTVLNYKEPISMPAKLSSGEYTNIKAVIDLTPISESEFNNPVNENFGRTFKDYKILLYTRSAKFSLPEMNISSDNAHAYFKSIKLLSETEGDNITKEWQGKNVAGRRYYMPFTVIWTAEKGKVERNVAVTSIEPTKYTVGVKAQAKVGVRNLGKVTVTTNVDFTVNGNTQQQQVTLAPGDGKQLIFPFTPIEKSFSITGEANKARHFEETTYTDNKKTVNCTAEEIDIPTNKGDCSDLLYWTEQWSHKVTYKDSEGKTHTYTCYHSYTYSSKLSANLTISPKTFKSGYGFGVRVIANVGAPKLVRVVGCGENPNKAAARKPSLPTAAEVRLPWKVTNRNGTQPKTINLEKVNSTASSVTFEPKANPISEIKAKKIYTPVELAGTKEKPVTHRFVVYVSGGGIDEGVWCKLLDDKNVAITINGNMYEDDLTSGSRP